MAKIPDNDSLGYPQWQAQLSEPRVDYHAFQAQGQAAHGLGNSIASLGNSIGGFLEAANQQDEARQDYEVHSSFLDFDEKQHENFKTRQDDMAPNGDGFQNTINNDYDKAARNWFQTAIPETASPKLKQKYDFMLRQRSEDYSRRAFDLQNDTFNKFHVGDVKSGLDGELDTIGKNAESGGDALTLRESIGRGLSRIDASLLPPNMKLRLREQFKRDAERMDALRRRDSDPDTEGVLKDIRTYPTGSAGPNGQPIGPGSDAGPEAGATGSGIFPVSGVDPASVPTDGGAPNSREHMGPRAGGAHAGWDIPATPGTDVLAVGQGKVIAAGTGQGYGNYIDVQYADGTIHRMAHLGTDSKGGTVTPFAQDVKPGADVQPGQVLGYSGYSGNAGREFPHVHYEIFPDKSAYERAQGGSSRATASLRINPRSYFETQQAGLGGPANDTTADNTQGASGLDRTAFQQELQDPAVRNRLLALTEAEVGTQGPQAQQAFMETVFNRAAARGQSLAQTMQGSYYPDVTHERTAARTGDPELEKKYGGIFQSVAGGSNVAKYATGNASGKVGFAGGDETARYGGERFGVEGPDQKWVTTVQKAPASKGVQVASADGTLPEGAFPKGSVADDSAQPSPAWQQLTPAQRKALSDPANAGKKLGDVLDFDGLASVQANHDDVSPDMPVSQAVTKFGLSDTPHDGRPGIPEGAVSGINSKGQVTTILDGFPPAMPLSQLPADTLAQVQAMLPQDAQKQFTLQNGQKVSALDQVTVGTLQQAFAAPAQMEKNAATGMGVGTQVAEAQMAEDKPLGSGPTYSDNARYRNLTPKDREQIAAQLLVIMRNKTIVEGNKVVDRIKTTGQDAPDANGRTYLERAKAVLRPDQYAKVEASVAGAKAYYAAVGDMPNKSDQDIDRTMADLERQTRNPNLTLEQHAAIKEAYTDGRKTEAAIKKLRKDDIGLAAEASPEVDAAHTLIAQAQTQNKFIGTDQNGLPKVGTQSTYMSPTEAREMVVEARMKAQARWLGDPNDARIRSLTQDEARALLQVNPGEIDRMTDSQVSDVLNRAAKRADTMYGKYADKAFNDAVDMLIRHKDPKDEAGGIILRVLAGQDLSARDLQNYQVMTSMGPIQGFLQSGQMMSRAVSGGSLNGPLIPQSMPEGWGRRADVTQVGGGAPGPSTKPGISQAQGGYQGPSSVPQGFGNPRQVPGTQAVTGLQSTPAADAKLLQNPTANAAEYERTYGQGSAQRAVQWWNANGGLAAANRAAAKAQRARTSSGRPSLSTWWYGDYGK